MAFRSFLCCGKESVKLGIKKEPAAWRVYSLKELHSATNNFNYDNKLGEGGFGSVYWGQLWDGSQIAVKRLKMWKTNSVTEFAAELETLARIKHKNLISLRGYCSEGQERLIVYEYMPNLSLFSHLHGHNSEEAVLPWKTRFNIVISSAEGISHLHNSGIVHLNIKASNVLLDVGLQPRISDFGIANLIPDGTPHESAKPKVAVGYSAPEYSIPAQGTPSCDVYSVGILLLEMATGKRPLERISASEKTVIADWALPLARGRSYSELADPKLKGAYDEEEMSRVVLVGLLCTQTNPDKRPSIVEVVQLLKASTIIKLENELFDPEIVAPDAGTKEEEIET